ncbi:MAG: hypothetical protein MUF15_02270 [Acidobacteria bacterium]|jgi:hypothetical protein|nr:hypothetical protein [Acidobacteriota bacterium]
MLAFFNEVKECNYALKVSLHYWGGENLNNERKKRSLINRLPIRLYNKDKSDKMILS